MQSDHGRSPSDCAREWAEHPVRVIEAFRDHLDDALSLAIQIHQAAVGAEDRGARLSDVCPDLRDALRAPLAAAREIWFGTPLRSGVERAGPVHLDCLPKRLLGRVSGSCYCDLALAIATATWVAMVKSNTARDWTRQARFMTAAGDHVAERWGSIGAEARCECAAAICELTPKTPTGCDLSDPLQVSEWSKVLGLNKNRIGPHLRVLAKAGTAQMVSRQRWRVSLLALDTHQRKRYDKKSAA